ncbi:MAG: DMT family transporter [Alphaproteobacteria bacterium]
MTGRDFLGAMVVQILWGVNFVVVKVGVSEIPPLFLISLRFVLVAILSAAFFRPPREKLPTILLLSFLLGTGHFGMIFVGLSQVDAAAAAIVVQLGVPFSTLLAAIFFGERLGGPAAMGMGLAFAGVVLLAGEPHLDHPGGLLFIAVAMMAWALSNVVIKRMGRISPLALNAWIAVFAAPQVFLLSLLLEHDQLRALEAASWRGFGAIVFTAVAATLIAYTLWCSLVARYPMNLVVPFTLLSPVIGVASGILVLGEPATWQKLAGGLLTIGGVAMVQWLRPREPTTGAGS